MTCRFVGLGGRGGRRRRRWRRAWGAVDFLQGWLSCLLWLYFLYDISLTFFKLKYSGGRDGCCRFSMVTAFWAWLFGLTCVSFASSTCVPPATYPGDHEKVHARVARGSPPPGTRLY